MKKLYRVIATVCTLLLLGAACACAPVSASVSVENSPSESAFDSGMGGSESEDPGTGGTVIPDDPEAARYAYRPQITQSMPRVRIDTTDKSSAFATDFSMEDKKNGRIDYVDCTVTVDKCEEEYVLDAADAEVKVRGNATLNYIKKPFRLKFRKKTGMLGLNGGAKCKSWVLLADWKDLSMLNNATAFYFGKTVLGSDGYYSTDFRNVNVYVNNRYWGVYLLVEQQQVNSNRVDITEPEEGYTGNDIGYLMEYDGYYTDENLALGGDYTFEMNYYNNAPLKRLDGTYATPRVKGYTIKSDIYAQSQVDFIRSYMDNVYTIAYKAVYEGAYYKFDEGYTELVRADYPSAEEAVSAVIDVQSLVDSYIIQEIACDYDVDWSSFYMDVDLSAAAKKLTFEAPWDWDSSFGLRFDVDSSGMYAANKSNPWLLLFINQPWFQQKVREKWDELYRCGVLKTSLALITECEKTYEEFYAANYRRWPERLAGEHEATEELNACKTQGEAAEYLYKWLHNRLNYLNAQWGNGKDVLAK